MKDLFRRVPLCEYPDYSSSHLHAGDAYQARFRVRPGRAAMWRLEQDLIARIFTHLSPRRALDFAIGTGRIAAQLESLLPDCELHGVDISEDMLGIAGKQCRRTHLHAMDGRTALAEFGPNAFDVVSAFRFFPNADPALRETVAGQIAALTQPGGHVVLNNHRNYWSTSYMALRARGNRDGNFGARNATIAQLFLKRGFVCTQRYSLGLWPQTDFRAALLPWRVATLLERANLRYLSRLHTLGYNTVFVFRKPARPSP